MQPLKGCVCEGLSPQISELCAIAVLSVGNSDHREPEGLAVTL